MFGLKFDTYGLGMGHLAATAGCERCDERGRVGIAPLTMTCPTCRGTKVVPVTEGVSREAQ